MISCKPIKVRNLAKWILFAVITVAVGMATSWKGYAQTMDQIVAGAKKEGEVRVSISVRKKRRGLIMGTRLIEAFQKKYPFIKVKYKRIGGSRQRERVFSELVGGMISYDVATLSNNQGKYFPEGELEKARCTLHDYPSHRSGCLLSDAGIWNGLQHRPGFKRGCAKA